MSERMMTEPELRHLQLMFNCRAFGPKTSIGKAGPIVATAISGMTLRRMERLNVVAKVVTRSGKHFRRSWFLTDQGRTEAVMLFSRSAAQ